MSTQIQTTESSLVATRDNLKMVIRTLEKVLKSEGLDNETIQCANVVLNYAKSCLEETRNQNYFEGKKCWTFDLDTNILLDSRGNIVYHVDQPKGLVEWVTRF